MSFCRLLLVLWGLPLLALPVRGQATPEPRITFEENAVVASGLTAGQKVAWFGIERRVDEEFSFELIPHYLLEPVAADGVARLELERPAFHASLWVAVDLQSGAYTVAVPEGYRIARAAKIPRLSPGEGALADGILEERPYVFGLVVRPGEGAWRYSGGDGGAGDSDGVVNGQSRFALDQLESLPGSDDGLKPPVKTASQEIWIVIDSRKMEISVLKGGVEL